MPDHYSKALFLLVFQSLSRLLVICHKGKSTSTSGEPTMWKPPIYKNIVKYIDGQIHGHFHQESLRNTLEGRA